MIPKEILFKIFRQGRSHDRGLPPGCDCQYEAKENRPIAFAKNLPGDQIFFWQFGQFLLEQVGLQLGLERATLETDSGTLVAIKFYNNTGWSEVI